MTLLAEYREAQRDAEIARLRRLLALRAMVATSMRQSPKPWGSASRRSANNCTRPRPWLTSILRRSSLRQHHFWLGSRRRGASPGWPSSAQLPATAREDSDIDLIVQPPLDTSIGGLLAMRQIFEQILGRSVDLFTYGGLRPGHDDDILRGQSCCD